MTGQLTPRALFCQTLACEFQIDSKLLLLLLKSMALLGLVMRYNPVWFLVVIILRRGLYFTNFMTLAIHPKPGNCAA